MPKLPPLSGREAIRAFERLGFTLVSQRGSHVKLRRADVVCIVPLHDPLKRGTLAGVLRQARVTSEDFVRALAQ